MIIDYIGVKEIDGSLVVIDGIKNATFEETVTIRLDNGTERTGRIVLLEQDRAVIQVFEGTNGISLDNTRTRLKGKPVELPLSPELLGRTFDGAGRPIDGMGPLYPLVSRDVNGSAINPVSRIYPRNFISTGISSIDCMCTLIRGQKLPIFSGSGMSHNELAAQIVRQAKIAGDDRKDFAVVFAAMGVKNDVADYFRRSFAESGVLGRVVNVSESVERPDRGTHSDSPLRADCGGVSGLRLRHAHSGHYDRYDLLCRGVPRAVLLQGRNSRQKGLSRLSLLRSGVAV